LLDSILLGIASSITSCIAVLLITGRRIYLPDWELEDDPTTARTRCAWIIAALTCGRWCAKHTWIAWWADVKRRDRIRARELSRRRKAVRKYGGGDGDYDGNEMPFGPNSDGGSAGKGEMCRDD
jgi:hypothetical protein